jgi:hypothetical protein
MAFTALEQLIPGIEDATSDNDLIVLLEGRGFTDFDALRAYICGEVEKNGGDPECICAPDIEEIVEEYDDDLNSIG